MDNQKELKPRVLVVDDEEDIRNILKFNLENASYLVDTASSGEDALAKMNTTHYNLVLLDVMMAGMSGFRMAEIIREDRKEDIPIIFLTARTSERDLLNGFSSGGDDYITKPFSIQEVLARVRAVLRRHLSTVVDEGKPIASKNERLRIDSETKMVYVDGKEVRLSRKEFELLALLVKQPGRVFSREEIISFLWKDSPYVIERTIDVHIARIRSKLGPLKSCITNRSGFGYCFQYKEDKI
ncbi:MAG TPA: DNA-binding response regulator [Rikenellaceae bacterium]|nr:DNA-binding response regulator [Rikenellaceae bacterium]